jgi:hypothetical protein
MDRPSFIELGKLVLTSTENTIESPKNDGKSKTLEAQKKSINQATINKSQEGKRHSVAKTFSHQKLKETSNYEDKSGMGEEPIVQSNKIQKQG